MKTTVKFILPLLLVAFSTSLFSLSDGAFNMTGAPGEGDCSACHSGVPVNSDSNGSIQLTIDSSNGAYIPGKEYDVHVRVSHSLRNRFGFALNTRAGKQLQPVGTFIADAASGVFNRSEFVAHRRASIDANKQKTWSFKWKAPDTATQDIIFYVAGVAADANNDNTGDIVYTQHMTLRKSNLPAALPTVLKSADFSVYPNPAADFVVVKSTTVLHSIRQLQLMDVHGKIIDTFSEAALKEYQGTYTIDLKPEYESGVYFLRLTVADGIVICKFCIVK